MQIHKNVKKNIEIIKNINHNSSDLVSRLIIKNNMQIGYIYLESVTSDDKVSNFLNKSIINCRNIIYNLKNNIYNSNIITLNSLDDIFYYLSSGFTILFLENYNNCFAIETRATLDRGVN